MQLACGEQAGSMRDVLVFHSCSTRILLVFRSYSLLVFLEGLGRGFGVSAGPFAGLDRSTSTGIQTNERFSTKPSDEGPLTTDHGPLTLPCHCPAYDSWPALELRRLRSRGQGWPRGGGRFPYRSQSRCPGPNSGSNWSGSSTGGTGRCGTGARSWARLA